MPESQNPFELNSLPAAHQEEMRSISQGIESRSAQYAESGKEMGKREVLKEVLSSHPSTSASQATLAADGETDVDRIKLAKKTDKLNEVVKYASAHGPIKASLMLRKIGDPWLEDQFHDMLIKFHDELVKSGKLKAE